MLWQQARSITARRQALHCAGQRRHASCGENVVLDDCDPAAVAAFAQSHGCGLVVIGPEAPLVAGVADAVRAAGIPCFGPGAEGAR
ncbi:MAG: hypothetical protein ACLU37_07080 [Collinsella sp.]